jgi:lipopolysaccharide export system permease protein
LIVNKYIAKDVVKTLLLITITLLLIALSNRLIVLLARAVNSQFPISALVQSVILIIPELLATLLPIALFCALLFSQSKLYADNEMAIMLASGFKISNLVSINAKIAIMITGLLLGCSLYLNSHLNHVRNQITQHQYNTNLHKLITPGKFQSFLNGELVFYSQSVSEDGSINNIFMVLKNNDNIAMNTIITAKQAMVKNQTLILKNGQRYDGTLGQANYKITAFVQYTRSLELNTTRWFERPEKPTAELLASTEIQDKVELQMRLAMPFLTIVLAMIAIPLAIVAPRSGRFNNFIPAILIFVIYYNALIFVNKLMLEMKVPIYSLWVVHGIFLLYASYTIRKVAK